MKCERDEVRDEAELGAGELGMVRPKQDLLMLEIQAGVGNPSSPLLDMHQQHHVGVSTAQPSGPVLDSGLAMEMRPCFTSDEALAVAQSRLAPRAIDTNGTQARRPSRWMLDRFRGRACFTM
jgi:hypothetical protein